MTMATGLVLAIAVGTMAQNSGSLMAFLTGETISAGQDDQFTVRAGSDQVLDVLANDSATGIVKVVNQPLCGTVRPGIGGVLEYVDSASCAGNIEFQYCVEAEDKCEPYQVALNVVNLSPQTQTVAKAATTQTTVANITNATATVVPVNPVKETPVTVAIADTVAQVEVVDNRQVPGQILVEDDSADIVVAGFNTGNAPSLFTPDMNELIQPQETVATLRRSTEVLSPSVIERDDNIQTQTSAATPVRSATTATASQDNILLGVEASPQVAFFSPRQPKLMPAPQLVPAAGEMTSVAAVSYTSDTQPRQTDVVETAPVVAAFAPTGFSVQIPNPDIQLASISTGANLSASHTVNLSSFEADAIAVVGSSIAVDVIEIQTASTGPISVQAADVVDSSDIVVEMAAQILLPATLLNDAMSRALKVTPTPGILMTDKMFAADLKASQPPEEVEVRVASIANVVVPQIIDDRTVVANARCAVQMSASARPGAAISVFVASPCRAGEILTLSHADFAFTTRLDQRGTLSVTIPAFTSVAVLDVEFDDGGYAESRVMVRDAADVDRLAVIWSIPVNLDIHAYEGTATDGAKGHVWVENPRTYRDTLTGGGGYLETFGDSSIAGGTMAEVYSVPSSRVRREMTISMDLRVNEIGMHCGNSMILRTVRVENRGEMSKREFNLLLPDCGRSAGGLVIEKFVAPISLARR